MYIHLDHIYLNKYWFSAVHWKSLKAETLQKKGVFIVPGKLEHRIITSRFLAQLYLFFTKCDCLEAHLIKEWQKNSCKQLLSSRMQRMYFIIKLSCSLPFPGREEGMIFHPPLWSSSKDWHNCISKLRAREKL